MTDEQIQALEALDKAADGMLNVLVDLERVEFPINASTLDALIERGYIQTPVQGVFSLTQQGIDKAIENRHVPPVVS